MTTTHTSPDDVPSDVSSDAVVFQHDWTQREELVGKIVSAVSSVTGTDETDVERVYDRLDPESLNRLFRQTETDRHSTDARLVFSLESCTITVHGSGLVIVQG